MFRIRVTRLADREILVEREVESERVLELLSSLAAAYSDVGRYDVRLICPVLVEAR